MLCFLILLLLWSLRLAKTSSFTLYICERHLGLEADSLRSLKPKHRRRLHTAPLEVTVDSLICAGELEKPLNMELLPQVLDVLHKKHSRKIKATWGTYYNGITETLEENRVDGSTTTVFVCCNKVVLMLNGHSHFTWDFFCNWFLFL